MYLTRPQDGSITTDNQGDRHARESGPHLGLRGGCMGGPDRGHQNGSSGVILPQLGNDICCKLAKAAVIVHKTLEALCHSNKPLFKHYTNPPARFLHRGSC